ncbi:unnamed protein product [Adineta steineri]|uniref:RING-type domain-containing protein n=1 Tax=Adineta steineri TaxID=433720 RepID=A0A814ULR6_9BILA|nr:unnamed protein product [Adineta steineri]CAF1229737.1 unnamed protein product [Adineta steineri]CAF1295147.1 unnamed protein product [Adineta steineri]CAF3627825.1 unnamed protein product [Adineta steineri]CAF3970242.1 unnamed protein product [Adineta steineri]
MGNCWRMPEDHTNLLPISSTHNASVSVSSSSSHPSSTTSDSSIPKLVTLNRSSVNSTAIPTTDINVIKAAQCRNLFEHLPLIKYNEKTIKQTDCAICLIDFLPNEQIRQLPCDGAHIFHPSCIDGWLQKSLTCPHCSTNVDAALLLKFIPNSNENDDED